MEQLFCQNQNVVRLDCVKVLPPVLSFPDRRESSHTHIIIHPSMHNFKKDFPVYTQNPNLVFLDSAASAQKPQAMLDALNLAYQHEYSNIHRGLYKLSAIATTKFEDTRIKIAKFINAKSPNEIVFTKNATEAINLVADAYGSLFISGIDEILITEMEHHSNILPWHKLCKQCGAKLKIAPLDDDGNVSLKEYNALLSKHTKLVAITHVSNVIGTVNTIEEMIKSAHAHGAKVLVDACQSVVHIPIDVQKLNCDFLVFSAHKLYGPNGVGILYGKEEVLDAMEPYQVGGGMVKEIHLLRNSTSESNCVVAPVLESSCTSVYTAALSSVCSSHLDSEASFERGVMKIDNPTFQKPPLKFEAGTPCIAEVIAFGATIDYLSSLDHELIARTEQNLLSHLLDSIEKIKGFSIIAKPNNQLGIISFVHDSAHALDISYILDNENIAIRTGNHCANLLMKRYGLSSTMRVSLGLYNDENDIERFLQGLHKANKFF